MSVNWVMLSGDEDFVKLPGEQKLYTSPERTSLSVQNLNKYPGREPFSVSSSAGKVYLTNRRIIYLPASATPALQSFAAPLQNFHDSHVTAPWFGPNAWVAAVQPVLNGGIPSHLPAVELKMTFNEGGAYDFHTKFLQLKERLAQVSAVASESGQRSIDPTAVHLDQLPAYEESLSSIGIQQAQRGHSSQGESRGDNLGHSTAQDSDRSFQAPSEPPPGYEEVQRDSVAESFERGLRLRHT